MKKKYIIICMLFIILIVSGYPYVKAEVLTLKYGTEFDLESFEMIEDISYCNVLEYDKQKAKVLYVCKGELSFLVTYQKIVTGRLKLGRVFGQNQEVRIVSGGYYIIDLIGATMKYVLLAFIMLIVEFAFCKQLCKR